MRLDRDVAALLQTHGRDMIVLRPSTEGTFNPRTGAIDYGAGDDDDPTSYTLRGVFISYYDRDIDGTRVQAADRKLLVQARGLAVTPKIGDTVDGNMSIIGPVRTLQSGATVIAYTCQTRG